MNIQKALGEVDFNPLVNMYSGRKLAKLQNAVNLSEKKFSANKFFMHIYNMSVTYLQSIKRVQ